MAKEHTQTEGLTLKELEKQAAGLLPDRLEMRRRRRRRIIRRTVVFNCIGDQACRDFDGGDNSGGGHSGPG